MSLLYRCSIAVGLPQYDLFQIIRSAPYRYKVFTIPKRSSGMRVIAQPAVELKTIQNWLISKELNSLPVHSCAMAYKKGTSIKMNAKAHVDNNYLLKMDFKDFFPSIKPDGFPDHVRKYMGDRYNEDEMKAILRILFYAPKGNRTDFRLSIGAPSSPFISNTLMYEIDELINKFCKEMEVSYTRYADDLTFSTRHPHRLDKVMHKVEEIIKQTSYPNLHLNKEKTVFTSRKHNRRVTGLVLSSEGKVSLGRERKRLIRAMIHRYVSDHLSLEEIYKLKGLLAFAKDVEPSFVASMTKKYSYKVIGEIYGFTQKP